jgi:hypothetical protein
MMLKERERERKKKKKEKRDYIVELDIHIPSYELLTFPKETIIVQLIFEISLK